VTKKDELISGSYVQALPSHIGSFEGDEKLRILKEKLKYLQLMGSWRCLRSWITGRG
jgi:hypothetical protein